MKPYHENKDLQDLYLEDSYVLSIAIGLARASIEMDFVLTESHPAYHPPLNGEQYCYRRGQIVFEGFTGIGLTNIVSDVSIDASGEKDFGNIYYLRDTDHTFEVVGDWGEMEIRGGSLSIELSLDE